MDRIQSRVSSCRREPVATAIIFALSALLAAGAFGSAIVVGVATAGGPVAASMGVSESRHPSFVEMKEVFELADTAEERLEILGQIRDAALRARLERRSGFGQQLVFVGHRLYRLGKMDEALGLFKLVASEPEIPAEEIDALRMIGQIEMNRGNHAAAEPAYREQVRLVLAQPDHWRYAGKLKMGVFGLSAIQRTGRRFEESMATRALLLTTPGVHLNDGERGALYLENARDARDLGRLEEASLWYRRLFTEAPDFGRDNGGIVDLLVESIRAEGLPWASSEYAGRIALIWHDPNLAPHVQIFFVGQHLAHVLAEAQGRHADAERVLVELRSRLDRGWPSLTEAEKSHLLSVRADTAFRLAVAAERAGRLHEASLLHAGVMRLFPGTPQAEAAERHLHLLSR